MTTAAASGAPIARASGRRRSISVLKIIPKMPVAAPCSKAVPSPRGEPQDKRGIDGRQIHRVLDERKPCADRKAGDQRIDEEPDAVGQDQGRHQQRLGSLLGQRRNIPVDGVRGQPLERQPSVEER